MKPTGTELYYDQVLTNVSVAYQNGELIADKIMPVVTVKKESGYYYEYDRSNQAVESDVRAPGTRANRVDWGLTRTPYGPLVEHSLEAEVTKEDYEQADTIIDALSDATETVKDNLLQIRENKLATYMATSGNFTNKTTLSGNSQFNDYANSDPIGVVETAKETVRESIGISPNAMWMGKKVYDKLVHHPDLLERFKYSERGVLTMEHLKALFGVDQIWIGDRRKMTSAEGQAFTGSDIWGKHLWVGRVAPTLKLKQITFGYHLMLEGSEQTEKWYEVGPKSYYVRTSMNYEQKTVAEQAVYAVFNAVN